MNKTNKFGPAAAWPRLAWILVALAAGGALAPGRAATAADAAPKAGMRDVLDMPPAAAALTPSSPASAVSSQGRQLVAVGPRGLIARSGDDGAQWQRVASPVQADLVAVKFTGPGTLWAVGHDAVALRSTDAGASWQRMLDGRSLLALLRGFYGPGGGGAASPEAAATLREIERWATQSATPGILPTPFFDLYFSDARQGFLVGAFGLILHTGDGGASWTPWLDRSDNPRRLHLHAVGGHGGEVYVAGEQGMVLKLDRGANRFVQIKTPYEGSFFGLDVQPGRLLLYGLRGNAFVSADAGAQWRKLDTGIDASLVAAVPVAGGALQLVAQSGQVLTMAADAMSVAPLRAASGGDVLGAAGNAAGALVLARLNGLHVLAKAVPAR